jgi:glycosyltransferase involved in cell wall biosynthesis
VSDPWLVLRGSALAWGGDTRRRYLFDALIRRTGARAIDSWKPPAVAAAFGPEWRFWSRPHVASVELLSRPAVDLVRRRGRPAAVDLHDEPIAASIALGIPPDAEARNRLQGTWQANLDTFPSLIVPTGSFAELFGLEPARTIVAANGTDTRHIRPAPPPMEPLIGLASGAGPGRGIEMLVEACRLVRREHADARLGLWLVGTSDGSRQYLETLRVGLAREDWIELATIPYAELPAALGRAAVLCIPHPSGTYFDVALPIKLADYMAAGRPVVVTPRTETARVVRRFDTGMVTEGDRSEDLAAALLEVLSDTEGRARMGANGRKAAEEHFDWDVIGNSLADTLLARLGRH